MARWNNKKNLTIDEKIVFAKDELISTKRQLKYFWIIHLISATAIIYLMTRSL